MEDYEERERARLTKLAMQDPQPCLVCGSPKIVGVATWIPDETTRLAAGGTDTSNPIFAFCLCEQHFEGTDENMKAITQYILRQVRIGKSKHV